MKLATRKSGGRDGSLVVVSRDLVTCQLVPDIARTLQAALDDWNSAASRLARVYGELNAGTAAGAESCVEEECASPLPRAFQWADGSAYLNHVELVRKARGAQVPDAFYDSPLMYQGGSDRFIGPRDPIAVLADDLGVDFEAEVAVVTGDVPMGATVDEAAAAIRLVMLANDVSLRNLIPGELEKGFGFFQSKPASAFSPVAVTPDELGGAWRDARLHLPLLITLDGAPFGRPDAGAGMTFNFAQLVAHAARTRELAAGSIVGSGTVSNKQGSLHGARIDGGGVGFACLAELRTVETIESGAPQTPYMAFGDTVRIEMLGPDGASIFGAIDQEVAPYNRRKQ
jgi:fumarylacetoacetate (FAA) hydrolase